MSLKTESKTAPSQASSKVLSPETIYSVLKRDPVLTHTTQFNDTSLIVLYQCMRDPIPNQLSDTRRDGEKPVGSDDFVLLKALGNIKVQVGRNTEDIPFRLAEPSSLTITGSTRFHYSFKEIFEDNHKDSEHQKWKRSLRFAVYESKSDPHECKDYKRNLLAEVKSYFSIDPYFRASLSKLVSDYQIKTKVEIQLLTILENYILYGRYGYFLRKIPSMKLKSFMKHDFGNTELLFTDLREFVLDILVRKPSEFQHVYQAVRMSGGKATLTKYPTQMKRLLLIFFKSVVLRRVLLNEIRHSLNNASTGLIGEPYPDQVTTKIWEVVATCFDTLDKKKVKAADLGKSCTLQTFVREVCFGSHALHFSAEKTKRDTKGIVGKNKAALRQMYLCGADQMAYYKIRGISPVELFKGMRQALSKNFNLASIVKEHQLVKSRLQKYRKLFTENYAPVQQDAALNARMKNESTLLKVLEYVIAIFTKYQDQLVPRKVASEGDEDVFLDTVEPVHVRYNCSIRMYEDIIPHILQTIEDKHKMSSRISKVFDDNTLEVPTLPEVTNSGSTSPDAERSNEEETEIASRDEDDLDLENADRKHQHTKKGKEKKKKGKKDTKKKKTNHREHKKSKKHREDPEPSSSESSDYEDRRRIMEEEEESSFVSEEIILVEGKRTRKPVTRERLPDFYYTESATYEDAMELGSSDLEDDEGDESKSKEDDSNKEEEENESDLSSSGGEDDYDPKQKVSRYTKKGRKELDLFHDDRLLKLKIPPPKPKQRKHISITVSSELKSLQKLAKATMGAEPKSEIPGKKPKKKLVMGTLAVAPLPSTKTTKIQPRLGSQVFTFHNFDVKTLNTNKKTTTCNTEVALKLPTKRKLEMPEYEEEEEELKEPKIHEHTSGSPSKKQKTHSVD